MSKKICVITIHDVSAFQSHLSKTIETMKQIDVNGVANLIMIGTPNAGAPLASHSDSCSPAVKDLIDHAPATKSKSARNMHLITIR